jgi:hypothetical protein
VPFSPVQRARKFSAVYLSQLDGSQFIGKYQEGRRHEDSDGGVGTHLGDLIGKELHDNSASGRAANGDVEEYLGVGHCGRGVV